MYARSTATMCVMIEWRGQELACPAGHPRGYGTSSVHPYSVICWLESNSDVQEKRFTILC